MTTPDLAGIIERDRLSNPDDCEACQEYRAGPAQSDRRALLALLAESEAEVKRLGTWVANRKARDKQGYQRWRETHPDEHRQMSRESMARTRARRKLSALAEP